MKLKFDSSLQYQRDAIDAVVRVFDGQPLALAGATTFQLYQSGNGTDKPDLDELGTGNRLVLPEDEILKNLHAVQEANGIEKIDKLQGMEFSVEMETGTGKTYVYLRSIFELNRIYGFRKFIVVVPSIAIREGVLKSIDIMKEHFQTLYEKTPFSHFVYDSKRLSRVRQFADSDQIEIMIINIQSFQKDVAEKDLSKMTEDELKKLNVINRENDRMSGRRPIEFIQATRPIVIIDEPQSVDNTGKSRRAIRNLNPLATLRYSATHRNPYNLLYKLDPIKAYDLRLVKRIEVASVRSIDGFNDAYVKLLETDNTKGIRARVEIHQEKRSGGPKTTKLWVRQGDDLYAKSGERQIYREGYIVQNIDCTPGSEYIEFNQGRLLESGQEIGGAGDELMRAQVHETVEQHLKKEKAFKGKGVKVLSLFFIDRVANYRVYNDDGTAGLGKIGRWFEEAYIELTAKSIYKELLPFDVAEVHNGYFSQDKSGHAKDTRGNSGADEDTYSLIMRDKERLLDPNVPLRFIFSHSALREGWDNPNVFQICTLNETRSKEKKRQEIGRGLRLPISATGERIHDETVNRLTVVANESYDDFARALQTEFEDDFGIRFGRVEKTAFAGIVRVAEDGTESRIRQDASTRIWNELVQGGYLSEDGDILGKFHSEALLSELKISDDFSDIKEKIVDEINRRVFKNRIADARERRELCFHKKVQLSDDFKELWERIKHRTRYRVNFDTEKLIERAVERIEEIEPIEPPRILTTITKVDTLRAGVQDGGQIATRVRDMQAAQTLPDILAFLQKETELTRHTLVEILKRSGRLDDFRVNPQAFMTSIAKEISHALHELILKGIKYEKIAGSCWEQSCIEQDAKQGISRYLSNLYEVKNHDKTLFDAIECDSEVEKKCARRLDENGEVKLFIKLPDWFRISTPVGSYNPDWAIVAGSAGDEERLYLVQETKGTLDSDARRIKENQKIKCGKRHFEALGVDFSVATPETTQYFGKVPLVPETKPE